MNKRKIFNDPVHGFITIPHPLVFDILEHPYFQRLAPLANLLLFTGLWTLLVYAPICHWVWGGGWLAALGTKDFAGGKIETEVVEDVLGSLGHGALAHDAARRHLVAEEHVGGDREMWAENDFLVHGIDAVGEVIESNSSQWPVVVPILVHHLL